jgi:large subunit ribosomal protein L2
MALKKFNPVTPSTRQLVLVDRSALYKGKPVKGLTEGLTKSGGRNNYGRITARFIGGGHKRSYRIIDFKRRKFDVSATVERIEYDPNRTAFIALIKHDDGELSYILAPQRLAPGDKVISGEQVDVKPGNAMPLAAMPVGTIIHNVELKPGKGGQIARSAGSYAQLVGPIRAWRSCASTPASSVSSMAPASPRSAPYPIRITATSISARLAARSGLANARTTAASP